MECHSHYGSSNRLVNQHYTYNHAYHHMSKRTNHCHFTLLTLFKCLCLESRNCEICKCHCCSCCYDDLVHTLLLTLNNNNRSILQLMLIFRLKYNHQICQFYKTGKCLQVQTTRWFTSIQTVRIFIFSLSKLPQMSAFSALGPVFQLAQPLHTQQSWWGVGFIYK